MKKKISALAACALGIAMIAGVGTFAGAAHRPDIDQVLLISIDGMHAVDYANCVAGGYCPNLASLGQTGVNYVQAYTSKPSDSFPGLMAIVSGGSPKTVGAYYDVAYDRSLQPPKVDTGNGVAAGSCTSGQVPTGTTTEYEEGIDFDQTLLDGGASMHGGVAINPDRLPRDPANNCAPVQPYNFVRVNTIFGVIHAARGYTAWSDKHPAYDAVAGPGDGTNLDDFYGPEINSNEAPLPQVTILGNNFCNPLPDQPAFLAGDDYTGSFQNIQCYDALKVQSILHEIDGKNHDGTRKTKVPVIFGMNFQAVSIGQKLIYQHGSVATGYSVNGGYLDANGTPSPSLLNEMKFVDSSIGMMVNELAKTRLIASTLIVITAKHGQAPVDTARFFPIPGHSGTNGMTPATILANAGFIPDSESPLNPTGIGATEDDVSLLWLKSISNTPTAITDLETNAAAAGIGEILSGKALSMVYNTPGLAPNDPRTPDIIVTPNFGVVYTGSKKKLAEHGGFSRDDTNVMTLLSNPGFAPATVTAAVQTAQIAPTILQALGLKPSKLQAVQKEGTQVLPGLNL